MTAWSVALLVATAVHLGFQLTVTVVVYPALGGTAAAGWPAAHRRHSQAIAPLVVVVYAAALTASAGALWTAPDDRAVWLAGLATAVAVAVTATRAAPLHNRLGRDGPRPELLRSLTRADRARTVCAALALVAALAAIR